ncbi:hypothetical protein RZS08_15660, partial [Arthrospira platensis SPKY1]|nr:hypothetical protein [Arthrospira platensis SPKY1]
GGTGRRAGRPGAARGAGPRPRCVPAGFDSVRRADGRRPQARAGAQTAAGVIRLTPFRRVAIGAIGRSGPSAAVVRRRSNTVSSADPSHLADRTPGDRPTAAASCGSPSARAPVRRGVAPRPASRARSSAAWRSRFRSRLRSFSSRRRCFSADRR